MVPWELLFRFSYLLKLLQKKKNTKKQNKLKQVRKRRLLSLILGHLSVGRNANQQFLIKTSEILDRIEREANQWKRISLFKKEKLNKWRKTKEK